MDERMRIKKYSDLLMELAIRIDHAEFNVMLMGVFTRKMINRREMEKVGNFSQLISYLSGKEISEKNLELLKDLLHNIKRNDLESRIVEFCREVQMPVFDPQYPVAQKLSGFQPVVKDTCKDVQLDTILDNCNELDDDDMIDSQQSCVSMKSLSEEEKRERELDFDF